MRRSDWKRARRAGEAHGQEVAKACHQHDGLGALLAGDWALRIYDNMPSMPSAAYRPFYDGVSRGAARYIEHARRKPVLQAARIYDAMRDR